MADHDGALADWPPEQRVTTHDPLDLAAFRQKVEAEVRERLRAQVEAIHDTHHAFGFLPRSDNRTCCDVARVLALLEQP